MRNLLFVLFLPLLLASCQAQSDKVSSRNGNAVAVDGELTTASLDEQYTDLEKAYFASGCFWCTEAVFERVAGVVDVYSGYTGGEIEDPTYEQVSSGRTRHAEAVVVYYNPDEVSYAQLVEFFFASHDPTQINRQGPDVGPQYRSGIFYLDAEQQKIAAEYKQKLDQSGKYDRPIATEITAAGPFYVAEEYHQDYYELHPDNSYIVNVSKPKVDKFMKEYRQYLKPEYQ